MWATQNTPATPMDSLWSPPPAQPGAKELSGGQLHLSGVAWTGAAYPYCPRTEPSDAGVGNRRVNRLGRGAMIEAKHSAESFPACDPADRGFGMRVCFDQAVFETLMIPLRVIMSDELACRLSK